MRSGGQVPGTKPAQHGQWSGDLERQQFAGGYRHSHVAVDGLNDVAIIATNDAVYVGKLSEAQNVGSMIKSF